MKTHVGASFVLILFLAGVLLPGCKSTETAEPETAVTPQPAATVQPTTPVRPAAAPKPATTAGRCGACQASRTYPADDVIRLDMQMPAEISLNATFDHTIKVTNLSDMMVSNVAITEYLPRNFKFVQSDLPPRTEGDKLIWTLDSLDANANRQITIAGAATSGDCLTNCATVTFLMPVCAGAEVVEPKLKLTKTAPKEAILCDPIPIKLTVANTGTGAVPGVKVVDTLPPGMTTTDGKAEIVFNAGTLAAGQSKDFSATLKASKTGAYINKAAATSSSGLKTEVTTETIVRQPVLAITKTGPARPIYMGRPVTYEITVTSKGDTPATNVVLEDTIPQGVQSVKPSAGGTVSGSKVVWQLGTMAVNSSKKVGVTYTPVTAGTLSNTATAVGACADAVTASAKTNVIGIAAVLLEVVDTDDPVLLGDETTYIITATNQGGIASTNVQITASWEDAYEYISSSGDTRGTVAGNVVTFAPLPSLPAKAKATWKVVVRAVKAGDIRFKVAMNTAELGRPVEETEATQSYE